MKINPKNLFNRLVRASSKFKLGMKMLSLFLCIVLTFYVIPSVIYAEIAEAFTESETEIQDSKETNSDVNVYDYKGAAYEVIASREESTKHFHLEDGSYVAAQYNYPVHYVDGDGVMQDIDNALLEDSSGDFANSNARIKFAKKITGNETLFTLHDGNTKLTFSLNGASKGTVGRVTNNSDAESDTELQKLMNLEKLSASVIYEDILPGVDLEYIAQSLNIKENIIVKEKKDSYTYSFELKLNGLTAALTESGDIEITDENTGEIKYVIPAPVVYDSNGTYAPSEASYYTLSGSNKKYTLTVTVSPEWMNAGERAFPVTLDPAITTSNSGVVDTYIEQANPTVAYSGSQQLKASTNSVIYWKNTSLPVIPDSAYISNAVLRMSATTNNEVYVRAIEVVKDWDETLTWEKNETSPYPGRLTSTVTYDFKKTAEDYNFVITPLVRKWYSGTNYGVALNTISGSQVFTSNECVADARPCLTVTYIDMKGVEDYWSYSSHSAGSAGDGSINLATGSLTLAVPLLSTTDSLMPITSTIVYNSELANESYSYTNTETAYKTSYMPYGFKLNLCETVIKKSYVDIAGATQYYYVYADADGTEHGFYQSEEDESLYIDEDGMQKKLTVASDGSITITDDSKITKTFTVMPSTYAGIPGSSWYLTKISDQNGNSVIFTFDSSLRPTKISLIPVNSTQIDFITLSYNSAGKLKMVYNSASKDAVIFRYSGTYNGAVSSTLGNYLRQIDYAIGNASVTTENWNSFIQSENNLTNITVKATAEYTYNSLGYIISAKDSILNQTLNYTFANGKVTAIAHAAGISTGQSINYTYGTGYTDVLNSGNDEALNTSDDIVTRYTFDERGRAKSIYSASKDGTEIYGATTGKYETQENVKNNLKEQTTLGGNAANYILNGDFEGYQTFDDTDVTVGSLDYWTVSGDVSLDSNRSSKYDGMYGAEFAFYDYNTSSISQTVFLKAGEYTLSFPYTSSNANDVTGTVTITSLSGSTLNIAESITVDIDKPSSFMKSFTVPSYTNGGDKVKISISFTKSTSTNQWANITVDRVMLENNIGASGFNLVAYGSFDANVYSGDSSVPVYEFWEDQSGGIPSTSTSSNAKFGKVAYISSYINSKRYIKQRIFREDPNILPENDYSGAYNSVGTDYIVSGFARAQNAVSSSISTFRIRVDVIYYNITTGKETTVSHYFDFTPECKDWQFTGGSFSTKYLPDGTVATDKVKAIDVYCEFSYQFGDVHFDNISVVNADDKSVERYFYYANGLVQRKENGYYKEYYEYNDERNITRVANNFGTLTDYVYKTSGNTSLVNNTLTYDYDIKDEYSSQLDSNEYPYKKDNPDLYIDKIPKTKTIYSYNDYGLITGTGTYSYNPETNALDISSRIYYAYSYYVDEGSKIFGALASETDDKGIITRYYYDSTDGKLKAEINQTHTTGVCYTYDDYGRLTGVMPAKYKATRTYTEITDAENVSYTYDERNLLASITTESTTYTFTYDDFGNSSSVKAGDNTLATYEYNDYNGKINKTNYGNGFSVEYVYNNLEFLSEVWYNYTDSTRECAYEYEYTADGQVHKFIDNINGKTTVYRYDNDNRVIGYVEYENGEEYNDYSSELIYDSKGTLSDVYFGIRHTNGMSEEMSYIHYSYGYRVDGVISQSSVATTKGPGITYYSYDSYDRLSGKSFTGGSYTNNVAYTYKQVGQRATGLIESYASTVNGTTTTYTYTYDNNSNITKVVYSTGAEIRYVYDKLNQLIREDNGLTNKTYVYEYDLAGNITSIKTYALTAEGATPTTPTSTKTYGYTATNGWGDQLTSFNGTTITYDDIGNPLSYYNGYTFSWDGRNLTNATIGLFDISCTYNDEGIRTSKTAGVATTNYFLNGTQIIGEETSGNITIYIYDESGAPIGMQYHGAYYAEDVWDVYWYEKNLQGDIVAVYNSAGTKLVSYVYDAWGNATIAYHNGGNSTTAKNNPFRYRGYYYDTHFALYYLNSRYYDSNTGRFISADAYISTGQGLIGSNMYAYCENNPVMRVDPTGQFWGMFAIIVLAITFVAVVSAVSIADTIVNKCVSTTDKKYSTEPEETLLNNTNIVIPEENSEAESSIEISIDVSSLPNNVDFCIAYTNILADHIEANSSHFLGENKVDRKQLYGEIKFHIAMWDMGLFKSSANPANINIYSNGNVIDNRWYVDWFIEMYCAKGYEKAK